MNEIMQQVVNAIKFRYGIKTQRQISERLYSVSPSYLSELVNGNLPITKKVTEYFKSEFNINPEYMTTGKGEIWCDKHDSSSFTVQTTETAQPAENHTNPTDIGDRHENSAQRVRKSDADSLEETLKTLNAALNEIAKQRELIEKLVDNMIEISKNLTNSNIENQGRKN